MKLSLFLIFGLSNLFFVFSVENGLGLTPQMGYNTWNDFRCSVNQEDVKRAADAVIAQGLDKLGYEYVNLDDCWAYSRSSNGTIQADPTTFSDGIGALASYVHSLGLKFGIYTDRGTKTCARRPGSEDYVKNDAQTYANWGVDYLKEDSCFASSVHETAFEEYGKMRTALNSTGRPIFFSLCGWHTWYAPVGQSLGNSWRIAHDCNTWSNVINAINQNAPLFEYAGPGWNDADMLIGTNTSDAAYLPKQQSRTMFSMWAVMASPLLIGANIEHLSPFDLQTYSNKEIIAVSQDKLGKQGKRLVGGPLYYYENTFANIDLCNSQDKMQNSWEFSAKNYPESISFLDSDSKRICLNVDDCGTALIYYDCAEYKKRESEICGIDNQKFSISPNGQIISQLRQKNECVTLLPDGITLGLQKCDSKKISQIWSITGPKNSSKIISKAKPDYCLTERDSEVSKVNVWARQLINNEFAIIFLNNDSSEKTITCDINCFTQMGFKSSQKLAVRDLWTHESKGDIIVKNLLSVNVPKDGASIVLKLTPIS